MGDIRGGARPSGAGTSREENSVNTSMTPTLPWTTYPPLFCPCQVWHSHPWDRSISSIQLLCDSSSSCRSDTPPCYSVTCILIKGHLTYLICSLLFFFSSKTNHHGGQAYHQGNNVTLIWHSTHQGQHGTGKNFLLLGFPESLASGSQRDGSGVKRICSSCREDQFGSQPTLSSS